MDRESGFKRVSGQVIVPDTSYLIPLRAKDYYDQDIREEVLNFHDAVKDSVEFFINVTIRHEQLRDVRERYVVLAIQELVKSNKPIEARYRSLDKFKDDIRPIDDIIKANSEFLFKHHIKANDEALILKYLTADIMAEYMEFESASDLTYMSGGWPDSWNSLGQLMNASYMEPTDAMILNFAKYIEAQAILTCDVGFAVASHEIDVYMPSRLARHCRGRYNPS